MSASSVAFCLTSVEPFFTQEGMRFGAEDDEGETSFVGELQVALSQEAINPYCKLS